MALILLGLCCLSSSSVAGGFFGGFIPGTEPHFLRVTEANKMKEIIEGLLKQNKENKEKLSKFEIGADGLPSDDEERIEYKQLSSDFLQEFRGGELCTNIKEVTDTDNKYKLKPVITDYKDDVLSIDGTKNKIKLFEQYVGIGNRDDQISQNDLLEYTGLCVMSDDNFEKYMEKFK
jgi:hypothetical protein